MHSVGQYYAAYLEYGHFVVGAWTRYDAFSVRCSLMGLASLLGSLCIYGYCQYF